MNINRHNYEEYFILYMDNELNSEDRRMVEAFVQEHPDLKDELELLQQFKLSPDESISFQYKEDLLKENGEALITLSNYEEWLVLYIDNELGQPQRAKVETFISNHPAVAAELALLQKAKLQPETVVFAHKESLYRREEKVRPIAAKWWRAAAAILILGLGITTALVLNNKKKANLPTASKNIPVKPANENPVLVKETMPDQNNTVEAQDNPGTKEEIISPDKYKSNNTTNPVYKQAVADNNAPFKQDNRKDIKQISPVQDDNKQAPVVVDNNNAIKQNNNLPKPDQNPFVNENRKDDAIATNNTKQDNKQVKQDDNNSTTIKDVTPGTPQSSDYILASNGKKNKNRGIFRKIARTFEKRTNIDPTEDGDRLLVAGFAINMK